MTIALVQTAPLANGSGLSSQTFSGNTAAGNTVILTVTAYNSTGAVISSSSPTFGGSAFGAAIKIVERQSTTVDANTVYFAKWMFPNVPAGTTVGATVTGGVVDANVGATAQEFSGMGTAPSVDQSSTASGPSGGGNNGPADSGTTPAITSAPELVLGSAVAFGVVSTGPASPWTNENQNKGVDGYQIVTSSGGTYDYAATFAGGPVDWSAGVVTIKGTPAATVSAVAAFGDTDVSWEKLQLLGVV